MSLGPVCARIGWVLILELSILFLLKLLYGLDEDMHVLPAKQWLLLGSLLMLLCGICMYPPDDYGVLKCCGFWLMSVYLGVVTTMDILLKQISDILHYIGLTGALLLLVDNLPHQQIMWELILYVAIQYLIFARMYGMADVVGFVLCALFVAATGRGIEAYVGHMVIAFGLLALAQGVRRNIAPNGNLKHPVALFPYILIGFLLII